jgi:hypothetical protein
MNLIHTILINALLAPSSSSFGLGLQMYSLQEDFIGDESPNAAGQIPDSIKPVQKLLQTGKL